MIGLQKLIMQFCWLDIKKGLDGELKIHGEQLGVKKVMLGFMRKTIVEFA